LVIGMDAVRVRMRAAFLATGVVGALSLHAISAALAQPAPWFDRAPARDQVCARLESQLAALDRGGQIDARADQARRYEDQVNRQQADLERMVAQSRRMGCERTGFFIFGGSAPPQCDDLRSQIDRARSNLDRLMSALEQARGGGNDRGEQRQAILLALGQNACGPQYQNAMRQRGLFDSLFGNGSPETVVTPGAAPGETPQPSGAYRTVCVRKCDGSFFPISYATTQAHFAEDERICRRACPATEVELYAFHNQGEDIGQATSISGRPYTELPNAFRFRQQYDAACACKRPGESWAAAVRDDPTLVRGDIVVTDEKAKTLSQPKPAPAAKPERTEPRQRRNTNPPPRASAPAAPPVDLSAGLPPPPPARDPRPVGPQFIPAR
jgi:hypothetical protein